MVNRKGNKLLSNKLVHRRRGRPGNTDALEHGYYSSRFLQVELHDLDALPETGLHNEVAVLRVLAHRIFEHAGPAQTVEWLVSFSAALGKLSLIISSLLKARHLISSLPSNAFNNTVDRAISELTHKLGLSLKITYTIKNPRSLIRILFVLKIFFTQKSPHAIYSNSRPARRRISSGFAC